ncbi:DNA mismatch repair endonuclease MutL [Thermovibrio sp.]
MIKRLPEELIRLISSGQIAYSPKAVLKELLENALDSKPLKVKVEISTPLSFSVSDDGEGIGYRELPLAVERFATSKVKSLADLKNLTTYGFRGEALYAISQHCRLTIKSRHWQEEVGGILKVEGGKIKEHRPYPFNKGTKVEVEDLFFNAPVRKKSVSRKERGQMIKLAKLYAAANPGIEFLICGERFYRSSLKERIFRLFKGEFKFTEGERVKLFYSREFGSVRQIFLNRRPVSIPEVEEILSQNRVKSYLLFIELEPCLVDFNVSPTKEKVLIEDSSVFEEVRELFKEEFSLPKVMVFKEAGSIKYYSPIELIGTDGTVIVAHDHENFYFFDQHLVHERVNYEELLRLLKEGKLKKVKLVPPVEVELELKEKLRELGALFKEEGDKLVVEALPEILEPEDLRKLKEETVESVASKACKRAIKAGYKVVNVEQLKELFEKYLSCREREVCPHGRPIYYKIEKKKVYRELGRRW